MGHIVAGKRLHRYDEFRTSDQCGSRSPARKQNLYGPTRVLGVMDLTKEYPRSAKDKFLGLVSLKRAIDKAKAHNEGHLGEYDYDCPHDKPLFEFLGTNGDEFAAKVKELGTDEKIGDWVKTSFLKNKTSDQIERFNNDRMHWHPDSHSQVYFDKLRDQVAPGRKDIVTWFDLLDLDEKRPVDKPTQLATA